MVQADLTNQALTSLAKCSRNLRTQQRSDITHISGNMGYQRQAHTAAENPGKKKIEPDFRIL